MEDIFRRAPTLDKWIADFNLDQIPEEERERFLSSIRTVSKSPALNWLLSRLEATQVMLLANLPPDKKSDVEGAHQRLWIVRELRRTIHGFAQESTLEDKNLSRTKGLD